MELSKTELLNKFNCLSKFQDQKWFSEEAIRADCNHKELPLKAAFHLIRDTIEFIDRTKFSSRWEEGFSTKVRLKQIEDLLRHFCEDTDHEKAIKGDLVSPRSLHHQDQPLTIHSPLKPKKVRPERDRVPLP